MPELYLNARALLIPSLYESFGQPIVEAFSQGAPVINSSRGAIAGDAGRYIAPESIEELASALLELTVNRELVTQLQI